ncbi:hypothetical protein OXYTRIMIC_054 [Oxytricha trifallax]|uniref:C2H2-type domain-containing protein n=1 Tax=Oxytricha trifallax TaxID=1172189 RepID=A0A073HYP4_9SPIT|nr:hypothetical protein OXYTRIMIC_054 [Oxytricha trifallax]
MGKREKPEFIDATNETICTFCDKKFDKGTSIRTHLSLFHKQEHKESRLIEKLAKKTCKYCRFIFTRSNDCQMHEMRCQFKLEEIKQEEKRLKLKEKMGIFPGPAEVLVKVPKGVEMTTVKQRVKKLTYKLLTQPNIFEGDVRDLQM